MAAKKAGELIRDARKEAGWTQEQLARKVRGVSAADISKAERGELDLTRDQLKAVAKALGITQTSLLNAPRGGVSSTSSAAKKKTSGTSASSDNTVKVTTAERKLLRLYRKADSTTKQYVIQYLEGSVEGSSAGGELLGAILGGAVDAMMGKKGTTRAKESDENNE